MTINDIDIKLNNLRVTGELVGWKVGSKMRKFLKNIYVVISIISLGSIILLVGIINGLRKK